MESANLRDPACNLYDIGDNLRSRALNLCDQTRNLRSRTCNLRIGVK